MGSDEHDLEGIHGQLTLRRDEHGVPTIRADTWEDVFYGLGWVHARDRGGQIALSRLVASGRLCEVVQDNPTFLELDRHYRRMGFARHAREFVGEMEPATHDLMEAYCQGVNRAWEQRRPGILRLLRYRPEPYTAADMLALVKLMAFMGLAEGQRTAELLVVHAVRRGLDEACLEELFPDLDCLDPALIRNLRTVPDLYPAEQILHGEAYGSNCWAVSGERSASGSPILCSDPHLQVDRLPAIVHEAHLVVGEAWAHGATIPGLPGLLIGRNRHLAWGVVNGCADGADFFVERCRNGHYLRGSDWHPFRECRERILRKKKEPEEIAVYENAHGILEGDPQEEGDYLCWGWCGQSAGGLGTLSAFWRLLRCKSVVEAQATLRTAEIPSLNLVLADRGGDIGFQMIGRVPRRREGWSGLAPVAGWDSANDWRGWLDPVKEIPSYRNPQEGFIVAANEARRGPDGRVLTTIAMPGYRQARIEECLAARTGFTVQDMQALQYDVLSLQARHLLPLFLPYVPEGPKRNLLERWDLRYTPDSEAATLFENIYFSVLLAVFGDGGLGREWLEHLLSETIAFILLFGYLDEVLARPDSRWLPAERRDAILQEAVGEALEKPLTLWGERHTITFQNIFLGGKLPRLFGFDVGPRPLPGNHATPRQGSLVGQLGQQIVTAPAYHFVSDLGTEKSWTNLPGGASESRFSRYYCNDLERWLEGKYKSG